MKNKPKTEKGWSWMNMISGCLAGAFLILVVYSSAFNQRPKDVDRIPLLPPIALGALAGALLGGAAEMRLPADTKGLNIVAELLRRAVLVLAIAFFIALAISAIQYEASHPPPPRWEFLD